MLSRPALRLMLLFCVGLLACGANARTRVLRTSLVATNVARDTLLAVSKEREAQIVEKATSKDEGRAQLDAWRVKVDVVARAIDVAYRAIHDAALLNDAKSASEAAIAAKKALALLKDLKDLKDLKPASPPVSPPPSPPPPASPPKEETKP